MELHFLIAVTQHVKIAELVVVPELIGLWLVDNRFDTKIGLTLAQYAS